MCCAPNATARSRRFTQPPAQRWRWMRSFSNLSKPAYSAKVDTGFATRRRAIMREAGMAFRKRREALRSILAGSTCIRPGSVYDAISIRVAEDLGFEVGMFGGSVASLAVLGDPDIALITLTELAEQMRRMSRAAALPVMVDADHGYGNALNVRSTVQELETAGAAGLTIEDTLLPQTFGETKTQLISLEEGVGKMKAALDGRGDPSLVIMARTSAASVTSVEDAIARARAYEATGVDALFFTGIKSRSELEAIAAATTLPIVLGGAPEEMSDPS